MTAFMERSAWWVPPPRVLINLPWSSCFFLSRLQGHYWDSFQVFCCKTVFELFTTFFDTPFALCLSLLLGNNSTCVIYLACCPRESFFFVVSFAPFPEYLLLTSRDSGSVVRKNSANNSRLRASDLTLCSYTRKCQVNHAFENLFFYEGTQAVESFWKL